MGEGRGTAVRALFGSYACRAGRTGRTPPGAIARHVDDVLAVTAVVGEPALLVGHSSGGVVALETLVAASSRFSGAVIYEPPVVLGPPVGSAQPPAREH